MGRAKKKISDTVTISFRAKDEMNLAEFPFCQLSDKTPTTKVLSFSYDSVQEDGSIIRREWRVEGGAECGLPRPIDEDVYVGLMLLTTRQGFDNQKVTFTIYELLEVLGWDKGGKSYSRVRASLRRLRNLSIEAVNAFKDNQTKRYEKYLGFGIIDDYEINTGPEASNLLPFDSGEELPAGKSYIRWNVRLFRSFKDGYIKNLDHEFYRSLKSTTSKRLYRFLDKKFYFGPEISIDVLQLGYEHIGLSRQSDYPSKVWEKLFGGISELCERNYLALATRDGKIARFIRATGTVNYGDAEGRVAISQARARLALLTKQFLQEVMELGVNANQAKRFVKERGENDLLRSLDLITYFREVIYPRTKERLENPAGYLVTMLKDSSFDIPSHLISRRRKSITLEDQITGLGNLNLEKMKQELQYYQQLEEVGEIEFSKLTSVEQEHQISLHITEMMLSEYKNTYLSWPKDLLHEHAIYQIKKQLAKKIAPEIAYSANAS
ncbi:MAG: replication initiator protein A [bacterium]|nr:MAG: replication initiator protein A [bacterium]